MTPQSEVKKYADLRRLLGEAHLLLERQEDSNRDRTEYLEAASKIDELLDDAGEKIDDEFPCSSPEVTDKIMEEGAWKALLSFLLDDLVTKRKKQREKLEGAAPDSDEEDAEASDYENHGYTQLAAALGDTAALRDLYGEIGTISLIDDLRTVYVAALFELDAQIQNVSSHALSVYGEAGEGRDEDSARFRGRLSFLSDEIKKGLAGVHDVTPEYTMQSRPSSRLGPAYRAARRFLKKAELKIRSQKISSNRDTPYKYIQEAFDLGDQLKTVSVCLKFLGPDWGGRIAPLPKEIIWVKLCGDCEIAQAERQAKLEEIGYLRLEDEEGESEEPTESKPEP